MLYWRNDRWCTTNYKNGFLAKEMRNALTKFLSLISRRSPTSHLYRQHIQRLQETLIVANMVSVIFSLLNMKVKHCHHLEQERLLRLSEIERIERKVSLQYHQNFHQRYLFLQGLTSWDHCMSMALNWYDSMSQNHEPVKNQLSLSLKISEK
jgi:hypothetical protein